MKRYNVISGTALTGAGAEIYEDEEGRFVKYSDHLAAVEQARKDDKQHIEILEHNLAALQGDDWRHAIDQELSNWHTTADSYATPREAVKALIAFEVMTALDPKVSSDAAALVEQARKEVSDMWLNAVTSVVSVKQAQEISHAILAQRNP